MNRLFYIMGKSASGKDTLYKKLLIALPLEPLVLCTTRPPREGECDGREYYFIGQEQLMEMRRNGSLIEERTYHTEEGDWTYCTPDTAMDLRRSSYLGIGTLESYHKLREYYGGDTVIPVYLEVEDGLRLHRALERERTQHHPKYAELCRRFLADTEDFSEDKLRAAGITHRFENTDAAECFAEITDFISSFAD